MQAGAVSGKPLISHVSIAVSNLDESVELFQTLTGHAPTLVKEVPEQQVKVAIFSSDTDGEHSGGNIELVSPLSDDSPVGRFIAKKGEGLHHICLYVDDLEEKLAEMKAAGARLIDETPKIGAEGDKVAFVHPSSCNGVLVELQEKSR
jgi:methylmalonyl-CoA/ethylmalonyl-CoA epimerase